MVSFNNFNYFYCQLLNLDIRVMRKRLLIIAFFAISLTLKAQQDPQFSQNMFNHMAVNPAFAGEHGRWSVSGIYRNQWQGMPGAPETYALNVDAPLRLGKTEGGVGLSMMSDKLGMQNNMHLVLNYSYKMALNFGVLSVGAKVGAINTKIQGEFEATDDPSQDPALNGKDIDLSKILFDAGMGVFLSGQKFYAGAAVSHLTRPKVKIGLIGEFFWARHMYFTGGYTFEVSPRVDLQPSTFIKTDFVSSQFSVNANVVYNKMFWGGISYRYEEAVVFMAGIELRGGLMLGYSYDWNVSKIGKYTGGSHEATLSYVFGMSVGKKQKIYKSVRFL